MELSKSRRESESAAGDGANGEEQPLLSRDNNTRESSSSSHARQGQISPYVLIYLDLELEACLCRASQGLHAHSHHVSVLWHLDRANSSAGVQPAHMPWCREAGMCPVACA